MSSKHLIAQQRQLLTLLGQVMAVAQALAEPLPATKPGHNVKSKHPGIYPHTSKYNPWRAYVWDGDAKRSLYIGAFPTIAKARAAQQAVRAGQPVPSGTKAARPVLRAVA